MDVDNKDETIIQDEELLEKLTKNKLFELALFVRPSEGIRYLNSCGSDLIIVARTVGENGNKSVEENMPCYDNRCEYSKQFYDPDEPDKAKPVAVTFGRFDLIVRGVSVNFHNSKAAELLALCIDRRGGRVNIYEAIEKLWPGRKCDDNSKRLYRRAAKRIEDVLRELGVSRIFSRSRGSCCVMSDSIICDYYDYLDDVKGSREKFTGKYMIEYSWGETTLAKLVRLKMSRMDIE